MWSLVKKRFQGKLSIKEARKQQNAIEKKITELHNRLNPSGPGKRMNLSVGIYGPFWPTNGRPFAILNTLKNTKIKNTIFLW